MGSDQSKPKVTFAEVKEHVEATCGWRHVFETFAGDSLGPAMRAKKNDHVDCPLPSHGGKDDFRLMADWEFPGRHAGRAICTCHTKGIGPFDILHQLGIFATAYDACKAIAEMTGLMEIGSGPKARPQPVKPANTQKSNTLTPARAKGLAKLYQRLWSEAYRLDHVASEIGRMYLRNRGVDVSKVLTNIRFHPALEYNLGKEKMILPGLLMDVSQFNGERCGLHRTFLSEDGTKADLNKCKLLTPFCLEQGYAGSAARIITVEDCDVLNVAEGMETALAAYHCTGETTWTTLDSVRMADLRVPSYFRRVRIWADNDKGFEGINAARKLMCRLLSQGFEVEIMEPNAEPGVDWLDIFNDTHAILVSMPKRLPYMKMCAMPQGLKIAA